MGKEWVNQIQTNVSLIDKASQYSKSASKLNDVLVWNGLYCISKRTYTHMSLKTIHKYM